MPAKNKHLTLQFALSMDGKPEEELPLMAYLFSGTGRLLSSVKVAQGNITLKGDWGNRKDLRLFIAPAPPEGEGESLPSLETMRQMQAYEPVWKAGTGTIQLMPIPDHLWPGWIRRCRVRGRVVVPTLVGGAVQELPLPCARVHICEVDPRFLLLKRIPNTHIFKLRDDLLKLLDRTWIPLPDPDPDPGPWRLQVDTLGWGHPAYLDPQPEPPAPMSLEVAAKVLESAIPHTARMKLLSTSSLAVRNALIEHLEAFWPVLCHWHWHWPWLWLRHRSWERRVVNADAQGHFDTSIFYSVFGDHPDLYFWVEYFVDGAWVPVYKPSLRCHTWWNFPSGTEVTLSVTDPRVNGNPQGPDVPDGSVLVERFGNVWLGEINGDGTIRGESSLCGLAVPYAFGGVICPHVEFSPDLDATHFRWSYQHPKADGTFGADEPWQVISAPLTRIYMEVVEVGGHEVWRRGSVPLGPESHGNQLAFQVPTLNPPEHPDQKAAWWDQCRNNEASAFFNTPLAFANPHLDAGCIRLRLELFKLQGGTLKRVSPVGGFQIPPPTYAGSGDMESCPATTAYLEDLHDSLCPTAAPVQVFALKLRLDNRPTKANIIPTTVTGCTAGCSGILTYTGDPVAVTASLAFQAEQKGGFAAYAFNVKLGHLSPVQESSKGVVGQPGGNGYALISGAYRKTVSADTLLDHQHTPGSPCVCTPSVASNLHCHLDANGVDCSLDSGAFSESLSVYAAITNGYERLSHLDSYDHAGFALVKG